MGVELSRAGQRTPTRIARQDARHDDLRAHVAYALWESAMNTAKWSNHGFSHLAKA